MSDKTPQEKARAQERRARRAERLALVPSDTDPQKQGPQGNAQGNAGAAQSDAAPRRPVASPPPQTRTVARPAHVKARHWGIIVAFVLMVILPVAFGGWYLWTRAADQYASTLGFTVRSEESASASDLIGGISAGLGGGSASRETDILFEYIGSQEMVRKVNETLDLETRYSLHAERDPLMSYDPDGATIEDLTDFWQRMVRISYDSGTGLMELLVLAYTPEDATLIAEAIFAESSELVNELSSIARSDATRYAQRDLDVALDRLKEVREAFTSFRLENQIVDLDADIQGQMGLLNTLQAQQAAALIEYDLISETAGSSDPRVEQARRRLDVIEARIAEERQKFGSGGGSTNPDGVKYATTVSEFERLTVDREYAEAAYARALAALDTARAEANRQSFYLAPYITPTLAERSQYPQRVLIIGLIALFSFLIWAISSLVYYALRDRK